MSLRLYLNILQGTLVFCVLTKCLKLWKYLSRCYWNEDQQLFQSFWPMASLLSWPGLSTRANESASFESLSQVAYPCSLLFLLPRTSINYTANMPEHEGSGPCPHLAALGITIHPENKSRCWQLSTSYSSFIMAIQPYGTRRWCAQMFTICNLSFHQEKRNKTSRFRQIHSLFTYSEAFQTGNKYGTKPRWIKALFLLPGILMFPCWEHLTGKQARIHIPSSDCTVRPESNS